MSELKLRPYQREGIEGVRQFYVEGYKKVLLWLATGGGKTVCFCEVLSGVRRKGKRAIVVVRGRHLVDQASQRLAREGIDHGVLMAGHWRRDHNNPIQVCSIDTVRARKSNPPADLIVIDEAHMATSPSYRRFLDQYPDARILAVTATPYAKEGLRHVAEVYVHPVSMRELINEGFLVEPVYYAPDIPDLSGIGTSRSTGDYLPDELEKKMGTVVGDVVSHYRTLGENRPSICFAVSIAHSLLLKDTFNAAGIPCEHMEAETKDEDRRRILKDLEDGRIKVVTNVGILCTGVDLPFVSCIIMARPTKSYNLYIQQAGRGTRPNSGKRNFILLDHAGNTLRHGFITSEREPTLDPMPKKSVDRVAIRRCDVCFAVFDPSEKICPECGSEKTKEVKERDITHEDGELKAISPEVARDIEIRSFIAEKKDIVRRKGYKRGWVYHQVVKEYGEEVAAVYMPKRVLSPRQLEIIREKSKK